MPMTPARNNGYAVGIDTPLNPATWNGALGDVHAWLTAIQASVNDFDDAITDLQTLGLEAFNNTITPLIEDAQTSVAAIQASLALAEDKVNELIAGRLPATAITYAGTGSLASAETVQQAIGILQASSGGVGEFAATASGAIGAGAPVVLNNDGTISVVTSSGTAQVLSSTTSISAWAPGGYLAGFYDAANSKVVMAYAASGTQYGTVIVGTVSGTTVTWGTAVTFNSAQTTSICVRPTATANQIMVTYTNNGSSARAEAIIGTISGTSVSFGSALSVNANNGQVACGLDAASGRMVLLYSDGASSFAVKLVVCTITGTTVTLNTPVTLAATQSNNDCLRLVEVGGKLVAQWCPNSGTGLSMAVVSVSGTTPSAGTTLGIASGTINIGGYGDLVVVSSTAIVIGYQLTAAGNAHMARIVTVSGTTLSVSAELNVRNGSAAMKLGYEATAGVIGYYASSTCYSLMIVSGVLTLIATKAISYQPDCIVDLPAATRLLLFYLGGSNSRTHLPSSLVTNVRKHIGYAKAAAADAAQVIVRTVGSVITGLSGLTVGTTYYLDYNSTLSATVPAEGSGEIGYAVSPTAMLVTKVGPRT